MCGESLQSGIYRCVDCVGASVMCLNCLTQQHFLPHLHVFEQYLNGVFVQFRPKNPTWKDTKHEKCGTTYEKDIVVVDEKGRQHLKTIQMCACEEEAVTLMSFSLWPSSPKHPRLAFHTELLYWLNGLLLECHVSVRGFCEALKARLPKSKKDLVIKEGREIYRLLMNETIHQFRNFVYQMDFPTTLFPDIDNGSECPACYDAERLIFCLDADFQLVRKLSSEKQWMRPKHEGLFFIDQCLVDQHMEMYQSPALEKDCSNFQAGSSLRSKAKNRKLCETAVFGATCRNDFPQKFFSLKHGERLGYAVFLMEYFIQQNENKQLHFSYDIACLLKKHLEKCKRSDLLERSTFSIPIFHCYGHTVSCQVLFSPRKMENLGLTDGEGIERLWSYLGGFSSITKEMSPENRTDLLSDGLLHYSKKIKENLGEVLVKKLKRAIELRDSSRDTLSDIFKEIPESDASILLPEWIEEERCLADKTISNSFSSSQESPNLQKLKQIQKLSIERHYLLRLLKKYAKGQSIFCRLSKQLNGISKKIKKHVEQYNEIQSINGLPVHIDYQTVKNVESEVFRSLPQLSSTTSIPLSLRQETVHLSNLVDRCNEEEKLVKEEMKSVYKWHEQEHSKIKTLIYQTNCEIEMSVLMSEVIFLEKTITELYMLFCNYIELTPFICNYIIGLADNRIKDIFISVKDEEDIQYDSESDIEDLDEEF